MATKCVCWVFLISLLVSSSFANDISYYDLSCEKQAEYDMATAKLRDIGYSRSEIKKHVEGNYPQAHQHNIIVSSETVFTLKNFTPEEIYITTLDSCKNRGLDVSHSSMNSEFSLKDFTGVITQSELDKCTIANNSLNQNRDMLSKYERQLKPMDEDLRKSMERINSNPTIVSKEEISAHNAKVDEFERTVENYNKLSSEYSIQSVNYRENCSGKLYLGK